MSRTLPHSLDAEEFLLAAILIDGPRVMTQCIASNIGTESFLDAKNGVIWASLRDMFAQNLPISMDVLAGELKRTSMLEAAGGYQAILQITGRTTTTAQAGYFIEQVRRYAQLRALIRASSAVAEMCYDYKGDDVITDIGPQIDTIGNVLRQQEQARTWFDVVDEAKRITEARMSGPQAEASGNDATWGFADLDRNFCPMEAGELVVLAARTSTGKSSLMRQIVLANALKGGGVLVESLEVTDTEAAINLAANYSGIPSRKNLHELHTRDKADLLASFDTLKIPSFSVCHQDKSLAEIKARAKAFKDKHGLKMLAVDFLGLVHDAKYPLRGERIDQAIGRVTGDLKQFAVQEGIIVLLLAQLNRGVEKDNQSGPRRPMLSDLRDSGRIEEDANRVILLHRPTEYDIGQGNRTQKDTDDIADTPRFYVEVIQAKGRNHGTGMVGMSFDRKTATFKQLAR
jgi:replicative DNA helicase